MSTHSQSPRIYNAKFWLLSATYFFFMLSFNILLSEIPAFMKILNGEQYLGLFIPLFAASALLARPLSGKLTDKIGRVPVMVIGAIIGLTANLLYPLVKSIGAFLALRFFHGWSAGFKPTAIAAYLSDIVPVQARAQAMGFLGFFSAAGIAAGPPIGSYIAQEWNLKVMFYTASACMAIAIMLLNFLPETLKGKEPLQKAHFKLTPKDVIDLDVLLPFWIMVLTVFSFGVVLTLIPDFSDSLGLKNRGEFYLYFISASMVVRLFGKFSDRFGRVPMMIVGCFILIIGMLVLATASTHGQFIWSGIVIGIAAGINSPTIFAWTMDLAHPENIGRAMATLFIGLEFGILCGGLFGGYLYAQFSVTFFTIFSSCAGLGLVALLVLVYQLKSTK